MPSKTIQPSVSFTISADDYISSCRLLMRRRYLSGRNSIIIVVMVLASVLAISVSERNSAGGNYAVFFAAFLFAWVFLHAINYFILLPRRASRIFRLQKTMQYPVEASWGCECYAELTSVLSSKVPWSDYYGWAADKSVILLMQSPIVFQIVPRRLLSIDQTGNLLEHLDRFCSRKI